jgi:post-segregation antitoxin (ccd killing protein)
MKKLKDYQKQDAPKHQTRVITVSVDAANIDFLKEKRINISQLVRDLISEYLIKENKNEYKERHNRAKIREADGNRSYRKKRWNIHRLEMCWQF